MAEVGGAHMVHLYERDSDLCGEAARFIGDAVAPGDVAIVIATEDHRRACLVELAMLGIDGEGRDSSRAAPSLRCGFAALGLRSRWATRHSRLSRGGGEHCARASSRPADVCTFSVKWSRSFGMRATSWRRWSSRRCGTNCAGRRRSTLLCAYSADSVCGARTRRSTGASLPGAFVRARGNHGP